VWWFTGSPLAALAGTLELQAQGAFERIGPAVVSLESEALGLVAVEFIAKAPLWPQPWRGDWVLRFERDTRGKFSRLQVSIGDEFFTGLEAAIARLDRDQLKSVRVTTSLRRGPSWREQTRASLEGVLRSQRRLTSAVFELDRPTPSVPRGVVHEGR
jgi:hypothetical protein